MGGATVPVEEPYGRLEFRVVPHALRIAPLDPILLDAPLDPAGAALLAAELQYESLHHVSPREAAVAVGRHLRSLRESVLDEPEHAARSFE